MLMFSLLLFDGLAWTAVYCLIIRRGFIDKSIGMPIFAACFNVSWECIFSFIYPHDKPQLFINYLWLFLDLVILLQVFLFVSKEFIKYSRIQVYVFLTLIATSTFTIELYFTKTLDPYQSGMVLAYLQNLVMSILFLAMINNRKTIHGQSIYIGILKMLGTLSISIGVIMFHSAPTKPLVICLSSWILLFDLIYIFSIYHKCLQCSVNPWMRL